MTAQGREAEAAAERGEGAGSVTPPRAGGGERTEVRKISGLTEENTTESEFKPTLHFEIQQVVKKKNSVSPG